MTLTRRPGRSGGDAPVGRRAPAPIFFLIANLAVSGINVLYNVVFSRRLGPADYSALGSLLALIGVLSVPLDAVQLAFAQAAGRVVEVRSVRRSYLRVAVYAGAIVAAVLALQEPVKGYLHLHQTLPVALTALWLGTAVMCVLPQGVLLGERRFVLLALSGLLGAGITRLALGLLFAAWGGGLNAALVATLVGQSVTLAISSWGIRQRLRPSAIRLVVKRDDALRSVVALTGIAALATIDTTLARHFLIAHDAGYYTAAATAARIALFASGNITLIAFPRFVASHAAGRADARTLALAAVAVGGLGLAAAALLAVFPTPVVHLLFGQQYGASGALLSRLAIAGALMGLVSLLTFYLLAYRSRWAAVPWLGTGLLVIATDLTSRQSDGLTPLRLCYLVIGSVGISALVALIRARYVPLTLMAEPLALASPEPASHGF